jgi:Spy/CpxP family protein refolding chaperone
MKTRIATLGLVLALAGTLAAQQPPAQQPQAQGAPPGQGRMMGPRGAMRGPGGAFPFTRRGMGMGMGMYAPDRLVNRREVLGLTPDQVSRLDALAQDAKQARDQAQAASKPHWDQLAELWKQPTPDVAQIKTHAQAAMQAMEAARLAQLTDAAQAKAVLTPEQRGRVEGWADAARLRMNRGMRMNGGTRPGMPGRMRGRMSPRAPGR